MPLDDARVALAAAGQEFRGRLRLVGAADWDRPTPCGDWSVHQLTEHVVAGNLRATHLLGGASREAVHALVAGPLMGDDPIAAYDRSLVAQAAAFAGEGALERMCEIGIGPVTGAEFLRFRLLDLVVHAWDMARAIGADESLRADVVAVTWREIAPIASSLVAMGVFGGGPSGTVSEEAPLWHRLLDATGRHPSAAPFRMLSRPREGWPMTVADDNRRLIEGFWGDLYRQDFPALTARFTPLGEYTDIVTPDDDVARGAAEITARLSLAFGKLSKLFDEPRHLVAGDDVVMTEHVEHWEWPTGETMALDVASVHEISDGRITRWCDYWDMNVLTNAAPAWWFEHVLQGWK